MSALQTVELHSDDERRLARVASHVLASHLASSCRPQVRIEASPGIEEAVILPDGALHLLQTVLEELGAGQRLTVTTRETEISTQDAADLLNVSRPYLIQLLERGEIPFRKVGSHRRVNAADVLIYRDRVRQERETVLAELIAEAQELGLGY